MGTACFMHNMEARAQVLQSGPLLGALVTMLWLEGLCWSISLLASASRGRIRENTRRYTKKCGSGYREAEMWNPGVQNTLVADSFRYYSSLHCVSVALMPFGPTNIWTHLAYTCLLPWVKKEMEARKILISVSQPSVFIWAEWMWDVVLRSLEKDWFPLRKTSTTTNDPSVNRKAGGQAQTGHSQDLYHRQRCHHTTIYSCHTVNSRQPSLATAIKGFLMQWHYCRGFLLRWTRLTSRSVWAEFKPHCSPQCKYELAVP